MKRMLILLGTALALVATSNPNARQPEPTCTFATGSFTVSGCSWDGGLLITTTDRTRCELNFEGALQTSAFGVPDSGRFEFSDDSIDAGADAGSRLCAAQEFPDGGYEVICDRCPTTGNCQPDCTATFTP
ncbi:MAG: hypothetical protein JNM17_36305 [Archangium sp.]|nr:hypothetical protein [Archangium sp.]